MATLLSTARWRTPQPTIIWQINDSKSARKIIQQSKKTMRGPSITRLLVESKITLK